jgi:hypothetical protein
MSWAWVLWTYIATSCQEKELEFTQFACVTTVKKNKSAEAEQTTEHTKS